MLKSGQWSLSYNYGHWPGLASYYTIYVMTYVECEVRTADDLQVKCTLLNKIQRIAYL